MKSKKFLGAAYSFCFPEIVLGGFIGEMTAKVPGLSWLNFGESFGLNDPLILNLGILVITFGLSIRITMASIIGVIIAILIYHFL